MIVEEFFAVLCVQIPVGELQYQIKSWLAAKFEFLPITINGMVGDILAVDLVLAKVKEIAGIYSIDMEIIKVYILHLQDKQKKRNERERRKELKRRRKEWKKRRRID